MKYEHNEKENMMLLSNIETVPGRTIVRHLGLVQGSTVRAKHVGRDFMAGLKNLVGGELKGYTELLNEARDEAIARMIEQARQAGANAVVNVRFSTASVAAGLPKSLPTVRLWFWNRRRRCRTTTTGSPSSCC